MQDFSIDIFLRLSWTDPRLVYDAQPKMSKLTLTAKMIDKIWVPDIFFPGEKSAFEHVVTVPNKIIRMYPNGTISYSAR